MALWEITKNLPHLTLQGRGIYNSDWFCHGVAGGRVERSLCSLLGKEEGGRKISFRLTVRWMDSLFNQNLPYLNLHGRRVGAVQICGKFWGTRMKGNIFYNQFVMKILCYCNDKACILYINSSGA